MSLNTKTNRTAKTAAEDDGFEDEMMNDDSASDLGESSGNFGPSSSNPDNTNSSSGQDDHARAIGKSETAAVFRLRVVVLIILVITAATVSGVVLKITQNGEKDELQTQYDGAAYAIQTAFVGIIEELSVISALGVMELSDSYAGFPFQTLHNFNKRAANARYMTGALSISYCPIVTIDKREDWEAYVNGEDSQWMDAAMQFQEKKGLNGFENNTELIELSVINNQTKVDPIKYFDAQGKAHVTLNDGPYLPVWQTSPLLEKRIVNEDIFLSHTESKCAKSAISTQQAILGGFVSAPFGKPSDSNPTTSMFATYRHISEQDNSAHYLGDPLSYFYLPIFDPSSLQSSSTTTSRTSQGKTVVAVLQSLIEWRGYFQSILKQSMPPMIVVLESVCNASSSGKPEQQQQQLLQEYTYELQGQEAFIKGEGDLHNPDFDSWVREAAFTTHHLRDGTVDGIDINQEHGCEYSIKIYPTQIFMDAYKTDTPLAITFAIAVVFVFTICMFILYDRLVEQRQNIVLRQAQHTTAIVSSLFPKNVRDRLLATARQRQGSMSSSIFSANKSRLKGFLDDGDSQAGENESDEKPIADLFPACTVFFADIAGFTAWSSTREPEQVFVLLQTVYQKFDTLAKRRKVFKVETIGDSYMAVTGLPEPMANHAVTMVRFAWDCRNEFHRVTKDLEVSLGPDTADLAMRFGLHSGPVTAGVLRGDRARFQLFGDTVNTASRMESTGERDRVQISSVTAELVRQAGKEPWLQQRKEQVHAKGKGVITTWWVSPKGVHGSTTSSSGDTSGHGSETSGELLVPGQPPRKKVNRRLVEWMTDLLLDQTKKIVYSRRKNKGTPSDKAPTYHRPEGQTCLDEAKEEIEMPSFDAKNTDSTGREYKNVRINSEVVAQLREYVLRIAEAYLDNPFHNFEHACHVTMSVNKLLKRIVAPELSEAEIQKLQEVDDMAARAHLHDYTHGINGDPLLGFAITVSALVHDVDHRGVSNTRLIEEEPEMASKYHDKSVAEQNSLDIAWDILMEDDFEELRRVLFPTQFDLMRFRQLIVNVVLATDIMDKELNGLRKRRWERAFAEDTKQQQQQQETAVSTIKDDTNLRATIVIEHIIQASDVSHTMQHWHVYRKWNERLFEEVYKAFLDGRMAKDPSEGWYKGEIGFFDFYIIPLAKKLKDCRIFGVSSDEYLSYATQNRKEWELRGEELVREMMEKVKTQPEGSPDL